MVEMISKRQQIQLAREAFVRNEGIEQGIEQGIKLVISKMYKKGKSISEIAEITDYSVEQIERMIQNQN